MHLLHVQDLDSIRSATTQVINETYEKLKAQKSELLQPSTFVSSDETLVI